MKLFDEMKNQYIHTAVELANQIHREGGMPVCTFGRILGEKLNCMYTDVFKSDLIFRTDQNGTLKLLRDTAVPVRPSLVERSWLKSMLAEPQVGLFLTTEEQAELRGKLDDALDFSQYISCKSIAEHPDTVDKAYIEKFRKVLKAVHEKRYISFVNETKKGDIPGNDMIACRIEYSITEEVYRVSLYKDRPIKANLARMKDIVVGDKIPEEKYKSVREIVSGRKAKDPIVLRIENKRQAVERVAILFSNCSRKTTPLFDEDSNLIGMKMEIEYYQFDEMDMVRKILSFGPRVEVLGPPGVREKVIEKIREADEWCSLPEHD